MKSRFAIFSASFAIAISSATGQEVAPKIFVDPNPPKFSEPKPGVFDGAKDFAELTYHAAPKPLAKGAVTAEFPRFLGPSDDGKSPETHLLAKFPEGGLKPVWEMRKGTGYTSAIIVNDRLFLFDRIGDEETLQCLDPLTGKEFWRTGYPIEYRDRYGFSNGPRASAVVDGGKVYTIGVTAILSCHDVSSGSVLWRRDLTADFELPTYFFGYGSCPIIYDGKIILNLGGKGNLAVAAFDQHTGKLVWGTQHEWRASYASPLIKKLRGDDRLLVFAGGESDPPTGGLLCIDPKIGTLFDSFPWRAPKFESVNGSNPVALGENRVYISEAYVIGGVCLELTENLKWKEVWKAPFAGSHWTTPQVLDGNIYAFRGRNEPDAWLVGYNGKTGDELWRKETLWQEKLPGGRDYNLSYFRGCMLHADGRNYALGELGTLGILKFSEEGYEEIDRTQLFFAQSTWSLPVISKGLLYISQHQTDFVSKTPARLICYDLRGE